MDGKNDNDTTGRQSERLGSAKLRGKLSAQVFINGIERRQRLKLQHDMFALCDENRSLGGKHWRTVLKRFGLKESEVWPMECKCGGKGFEFVRSPTMAILRWESEGFKQQNTGDKAR